MTNGDLAGATLLADIAQQFGQAVRGQDYLRSARNTLTMGDIRPNFGPHDISQVMTGAIFDFLLAVSVQYHDRGKDISVADALWYTAQRLQMMAIQALDLLPPVEVTFRDYALAVLRAELVANPTDPAGYRAMLVDIFIRRQILLAADREELLRPDHVFDRLPLTIFHDAREIGSSRAAAYRFLDDNRKSLFIPHSVDLQIADVFTAQKLNREGRRLPRQVIVQYVWREDVVLEGARFGSYAGQTTSMLCGATLVVDENGNIVSWSRKPGSLPSGPSDKAKREADDGMARRVRFLDALASRIGAGMVGEALGNATGLLADSVPMFTASNVEGSLRFELTPHLASKHVHSHDMGGQSWQMSS